MKSFISTLILLLPFVVHAQFEWEELPAHTYEQVKVIFSTEDDRLIGYHEFGTKLFASSDQGNTWDVLAEMDLIGESNFIFSEKIVERGDGVLFTIIDDFIFRIDEVNKTVVPFFTPNLFFSPGDFFFLDSGEVIVANISAVQKYSSTGNLLVSVELDEGSFDTNLIKGVGDTHYIYTYFGITKFNSSLSSVEEEIASGVSISGLLIGPSGKLFTDRRYSTDGVFWTDYAGDANGSPVINGEGDLYLINETSTFVSNDDGVSFNEISSDLGIRPNSFNTRVFKNGNTGFIFSYFDCPSQLKSSSDGASWNDLSENLYNGFPFAFNMEAVNEGMIIVEGCDFGEFGVFRNGSWGPLVLDDDLSSSCNYFQEITSFPNGSLFNDEGCQSNDDGQTWNYAGFYPGYGSQVDINGSGIYVVDYQSVHYSYDNGETWTEKEFNSDNSFFIDEGVVSVSEGIYINDDIGGNVVYRIDFDGNVVDAIASPLPNAAIGDMVSSFNQNKVYMLLSVWNNNSQLMVYDEDTNNAVVKPLPVVDTDNRDRLFSDHGDNIYFMNKEKLFISPDHGDSWEDITPLNPGIRELTDMDVSWDGYLYVSTVGTPIIKSKYTVVEGNNLFTVVLYDDENDNCDFDMGDEVMDGIKVEIGYLSKPSGSNGAASFLLWQGENELNIDAREDLYELCSYESTIEFADLENTDTIYVGVKTLEDCVDLSINATTPFLRRCFDNTYYLEIYNDGTEVAQNAELVLILDEHFDFIDSNMDLLETDDDEYTFLIPDIPPRESFGGKINFNLSCDAELGQAHYMHAQMIYENACQNSTGDRLSFECRENIGSYDPNDKQIYVDGVLNADIIHEDSSIEYLIRFQNTGTDTAFTVRVEDNLESEFMADEITPVMASHDYTWEMDRQKLIVTFNDINLVDSTANEEASHGFILFKAKLADPAPEPGAIVKNTAEIYFDFNEPIVTNTVETNYLCKHKEETISTTICPDENYEGYAATGVYVDEFLTPLGCDSIRTLELTVLPSDDIQCLTSTVDLSGASIDIYPMPANDILNVQIEGAMQLSKYTMTDVYGRVLKTGPATNSFQIQTEDLATNFYSLNVYSGDIVVFRKKVTIVR